ncbi:MAG: galactose mutarotase, partial [Syntrophomonadaceae bacterium]|nr:galactose mutarotase [Syntrophomonadaceae bacterium]
MKKILFATLAIIVLLSCQKEEENIQSLSGLNTKDFVTKIDGKKTGLYILKNNTGLEACITNFGGRLVSLLVRDRKGNLTDVVLGYGSIKEYLAKPDGNYGALIGRYGNRIKDGSFTLDGNTYDLPKNNNGNCLHGGPKGFHNQVWNAEKIDAQTLKLTRLSKDGEAGFPGNLNVTVIYKLTDDDALDIQYEATTDKPTVVNLTNHSYFNISGNPGAQILNSYIYINADSFTVV